MKDETRKDEKSTNFSRILKKKINFNNDVEDICKFCIRLEG